MVEHTPGPWASTDNGSAVRTDSLTFRMVASIYGDDEECMPDERMAANARLIAAAPDLLALACKLAGECADCNGHSEVVVNAGPSHDAQYETRQCESCADIRAVIAKATLSSSDPGAKP